MKSWCPCVFQGFLQQLRQIAGRMSSGPRGAGIGLKLLIGAGALAYGVREATYTGSVLCFHADKQLTHLWLAWTPWTLQWAAAAVSFELSSFCFSFENIPSHELNCIKDATCPLERESTFTVCISFFCWWETLISHLMLSRSPTAVLLTHQPLRHRLYLNQIREVDSVVSFHGFVLYWTERWRLSAGVRLLHIMTNVKASSPCRTQCFCVQWYQEVSGPSVTTSQLQTVDERLVKCIILLQKAKEALKGMF